MSRFDKKVVNETWKIERTKSGRKKATGQDNGREVSVWVSDIKDADGLFPIMGRYLLPLPDVTLVDDTISEVRTLWVTKDQYKDIMAKAKAPVREAGFEDFVHVVAKLFDKIIKKVGEKVGPNQLINQVLDLVLNSAMEKIMDKEFVGDKLSELIDKIEL